jgi:hypothetical protein
MIIILNLHSGTKLSGWLRHWIDLDMPVAYALETRRKLYKMGPFVY